jgi:hypothetical protein
VVAWRGRWRALRRRRSEERGASRRQLCFGGLVFGCRGARVAAAAAPAAGARTQRRRARALQRCACVRARAAVFRAARRTAHRAAKHAALGLGAQREWGKRCTERRRSVGRRRAGGAAAGAGAHKEARNADAAFWRGVCVSSTDGTTPPRHASARACACVSRARGARPARLQRAAALRHAAEASKRLSPRIDLDLAEMNLLFVAHPLANARAALPPRARRNAARARAPAAAAPVPRGARQRRAAAAHTHARAAVFPSLSQDASASVAAAAR